MEVFPLDIKKMVIKLVSEGKSYNLRRLFCVNKMWRRLVSDYLINNIQQKKTFRDVLCLYLNISFDRFHDYDFLEILSEEWRGTHLLASFAMYLNARFDDKDERDFGLSYHKAFDLFRLTPFLKDLKRMDVELDIIESLDEKIEEALAEKKATERVFQELDEKWSNKRIKKE